MIIKKTVEINGFKVAGAAGLEPANDGVKVRCLTTWLYPNDIYSIIAKIRQSVNRETQFYNLDTKETALKAPENFEKLEVD